MVEYNLLNCLSSLIKKKNNMYISDLIHYVNPRVLGLFIPDL